MFKKLLGKLIGRKAAVVADAVLTDVADGATGGAASQIEDVVRKSKRAQRRQRSN